MDRSAIKRFSSETDENSIDTSVEVKRARHDKGDGSEPDAAWSQGTVEYELSQELSQGDAYCKLLGSEGEDSHRKDHTVTAGNGDSDSGTPGLSEDERNGQKSGDKSVASDALFPRLKWKNTSLVKDADTVTAIVPSANEKQVFDALAKHRANPNRLDIVTAEILDSNANTVTATASGVDKHGASQAAASAGDRTEAADVPGTSTEPSQYADMKQVVSKVKASRPEHKVNAAEVCALLEKHKDRPDRVDIVSDKLLKNAEYGAVKTQASNSGDIFAQAMKLNAEFPGMDPSVIYEMLEKAEDHANRLHLVRERLGGKTGNSAAGKETNGAAPGISPLAKNDSISEDPLARSDPVYRDMRIISRMFPEKDQNELYALVEAHYYKADRVQAVIEELLKTRPWGQSQENSHTLAEPQSGDLDASLNAVAPVTGPSVPPELGDLQSDVQHLLDVFPDCDPNYVFERLEANKSCADRVRILASEMFEKHDYPKLKETVEKQTRQARKNRLKKLDFTIQEVLAKFPDPGGTFHDTSKAMRENYKDHVTAQLKHDFPDFKASYVKTVMERNNWHYFSTSRELAATMTDILANGGRSKKLRQTPKEEPLIYPDEPDEYFFYELWYTRNEERVRGYFEQKEAERKGKVEAARARSELYECGCCFEDECLFEEMSACADGHLFCCQCIARSAEAAFGEGKTTFPCLTGTCEHQIPLSVLKEVLPSAMFSKILRKMQEEEVRQAGIPDLVDCPFCNFATIMPDPEDKVFRCLNPECLKDSCRLCREPNHVPLKCEEVEKQNETDMRTFIEKRVTEAMIRRCHRCGKHFVKDMGCNKMTCVCGATSCYICREPDIDYEHFNIGKCDVSDMEKVHQQEMEAAAEKAHEEYLRDHPDAADINLKYDPAKLIKKAWPTEAFRALKVKDYCEEEDENDKMSTVSGTEFGSGSDSSSVSLSSSLTESDTESRSDGDSSSVSHSSSFDSGERGIFYEGDDDYDDEEVYEESPYDYYSSGSGSESDWY